MSEIDPSETQTPRKEVKMRLSEAKYHELKALAEAWDASVNEYARMILMK